MAHTEKITTETPIKNNWFFNSIDGDNAVCDDYGFVLEAPDKETGKKLVTCWNEYDQLKEENEALKEMVQKLEEGIKNVLAVDIGEREVFKIGDLSHSEIREAKKLINP